MMHSNNISNGIWIKIKGTDIYYENTEYNYDPKKERQEITKKHNPFKDKKHKNLWEKR